MPPTSARGPGTQNVTQEIGVQGLIEEKARAARLRATEHSERHPRATHRARSDNCTAQIRCWLPPGGAPSDLRLQVDVERGAVLVERWASLGERVHLVVHARLLVAHLHRQKRWGPRPLLLVRGLRAPGQDGLAERRQRRRRGTEERLRLLGALLREGLL